MGEATYKALGGNEVSIPHLDIKVNLDQLQDVFKKLEIPPAQIHVQACEAVAPIINVQVPEPFVTVSPPQVNVTAPEKTVHVHVPPQDPPTVIVSPQALTVHPAVTNIQVNPLLDPAVLKYAVLALYLFLALGLAFFIRFILV